MHWLVGNWQLKLTSIVLTIALLAAVAFTQNPPTTAMITLHLAYPTPPSNLVLVNPPTTVQVRAVGLSNSVNELKREFASSAGARVDLTGLQAGTSQPATAQVTASALGVSISPTHVPIHLNLETMETVRLPVQVRVTNVNSQAGLSVVDSGTYATCGNDTVACQVTVRAPSSMVSGLQAYLSYVDPQPNQAGIERVPGLPVRFEQHGKSVDLSGNRPQVIPNLISVQPMVATARVETQGGTLTTSFPVFARTTGNPACGYQVQSLTYNPSTVMVSGPAQTLSKMEQLQLSAVDVSGLTVGETVTRSVELPAGAQLAPGTAQSITVTVTVGQAFSCTPSTSGLVPTPQPTVQPTRAPNSAPAPVTTPAATPAPTPAPTPTPTPAG